MALHGDGGSGGPIASIRAVSALNDDSRRRMYEFSRRAGRPITRDEAAAEVGISRKLAAFHLDKLVDAGLLHARYEAVGGIRKVGRMPKVYEPTGADLQVSIPPRQPDLLAEILLTAVAAHQEPGSVVETALSTANLRGRELGERERGRLRPGRLSAERALTLVESTLALHGFEPTRTRQSCLRLRSCPFHSLAAREPEIVCGINHAYLSGVLTGLEATAVRAVLDPAGGDCCVDLTTD